MEEKKIESARDSDHLFINLNSEEENFNNPKNIEKSVSLSSNEDPNTNTESIKSYTSCTKLYGLSFQTNSNNLRLGLTSIETNITNRLEIIEFDKSIDKFMRTSLIETEFPCSKVMWSPSINTSSILATTSDVLRLYKYAESTSKISLASTLTKKHSQAYSGPLTSMDWNKSNTSILGVCSIDTTCTIWDLTKGEVKTSLIAHDKEVYDICFGQDENTFITTGADGSIRLFDLRALDTCSILFDSQDNSPITRISWNLNNTNFVAALGLDKNIIYIIDQRIPNLPYAFLSYHSNVVNAITWAPNSNAYICSVGDDKNALIWDIQLVSNKTEDPIMSYNSDFEIENVQWSESNDEWIGITGSNVLQLLKIK